MNRFLDRLRAWAHSYFRHPLENIRTANPIVPNRLYDAFGNIVKAVPMSPDEQHFVNTAAKHALPAALLGQSGNPKDNIEELRQLYNVVDADNLVDLPPRCNLCDFYRAGIPCPLNNVLENGRTVCDTNRYIIIKKAPKL